MSNCNRYDIATYKAKAQYIFDAERKDLIKIAFVPDENFVFPETERCFWFEGLKMFSWLCYSSREDAAYCLSYVLFDYTVPGVIPRVKNLDNQPFRHWPAAVFVFKIHVSRKQKKETETNQLSHYIVNHGQFLMQFSLTWKGLQKKSIWWLTKTTRKKFRRIEKDLHQ